MLCPIFLSSLTRLVKTLQAQINDRLNAHELVIAHQLEAHISDVELIVKDFLSSNATGI